MNRILEVLRKSLAIAFQSALDKTTNQIPACLPVLAAVEVDFLVDGKATVELKIENGFRLLCGQIKLPNQSSHILIL